MPKRWAVLLAVVAVAAVAIGGIWYLTRTPGSSGPPEGTPAEGSCWQVSAATAATAYPWPGRPVACTARHTVEVFHVGHADPALVAKLHGANKRDARVLQTGMEAQARRACEVLAGKYTGGDWHATRVQVVADWIKPATDGYYGCGLAESSAPASRAIVARTAPLRGALTSHGPLEIACVARAGSGQTYTGCDVPHDGEFVGTYQITPANAPFDAAKVEQAAKTGCTGLVDQFVGAHRTDLATAYVGPTNGRDWLGSDQTYACYAVVGAGRTVGRTVKGIGTGPLPG